MTQPRLPSALFSTNLSTAHIPQGREMGQTSSKQTIWRNGNDGHVAAAGQHEESSLPCHLLGLFLQNAGLSTPTATFPRPT